MAEDSFYNFIKAHCNFTTDEAAETAFPHFTDGSIYYNTNLQGFKQYQEHLKAWTLMENIH